MVKTMVAALAAILLAVAAGQSPALAQPDDAGFVRTMRQFADITGGQQTRGGQVMDKVLAFGRNAAGDIVVTAMLVLPPGAEWVEPPPGAVAVMRTRTSTPNNNSAPDPADLAYAQSTGVRLFIVGEWVRPPVIWEVARQGGQARTREINAQGAAGPWRTPAP